MITNYPLTWPVGWKRARRPERSNFGTWNNKPSVSKSRNFVLEELRKFKATDVIISSNLQLRLDGLPYSNRKLPEDRGVAVYFKLKDKSMVLASDSYDLPGCNLWAIGKTIDSLRGIQRWGTSDLLERAFTGFKAIAETTAANITWYEFLEVDPNATLEQVEKAYKLKAMIYHPDKPTGGTRIFQTLQEVYKEAKLNCQ